jgi:hypothetical protein
MRRSRRPRQISSAGWQSWPIVKRHDWGLVYVSSEGRFGYYDDEEDEDECIVYFGSPLTGDGPYNFPRGALRQPPVDGDFTAVGAAPASEKFRSGQSSSSSSSSSSAGSPTTRSRSRSRSGRSKSPAPRTSKSPARRTTQTKLSTTTTTTTTKDEEKKGRLAQLFENHVVYHLCIYTPGTFFCNPVKPLLNALVGSKYGIAYAHFRRDHSEPTNVWAHVGCLFLQVLANFALLDCVDASLGLTHPATQPGQPLALVLLGWNVASFTAVAWALSLCLTPSPALVRAVTAAALFGALAARRLLTETVGVASLALLTGPFELACYWLYLPDHGVKRPPWPVYLAALAARTALWHHLCCLVESGSGSESESSSLPSSAAAAVAVLLLYAAGSLVRTPSNNLPLVSQFGSAGWLPALLLGQPWAYFLSLSFLGAGLQGVAHEWTGQRGTLNQLKDPGYELAHTSFFPLLTLQSVHHSWCGPHAATVAALGAQGDARSRKALGLAG